MQIFASHRVSHLFKHSDIIVRCSAQVPTCCCCEPFARSFVCSFAGSFYISNNAVIRFIYTRISWILLNTLNVLNCNVSNTDKYFHQFDGLYDYIKWYHYSIKINYCNFIWLFNKIDVEHICRENNIRMHRYFCVHVVKWHGKMNARDARAHILSNKSFPLSPIIVRRNCL